jgi:hypothetical protein
MALSSGAAFNRMEDYMGPLEHGTERYDPLDYEDLATATYSAEDEAPPVQLHMHGLQEKAVRLRVKAGQQQVVDAAPPSVEGHGATGRRDFDGWRVGKGRNSPVVAVHKGRAQRKVELFAKVPPPSPEEKGSADQPTTPGHGDAGSSPLSPAESPLDPRVVGRLIIERRREYGEQLRAVHRRKYPPKPKKEQPPGGAEEERGAGRKRRKPGPPQAPVVSPTTKRRIEERERLEKHAIWKRNYALRSEAAMKKMALDKRRERLEEKALNERREQVEDMARIVRIQNKLRAQAAARLAAASPLPGDEEELGHTVGKENILKIFDIQSAPVGTGMKRRGGAATITGTAGHTPPKPPAASVEPLPLPPRKPRVPRLSGRKPGGDSKPKETGETIPAVLTTRKPPVPRLSVLAAGKKTAAMDKTKSSPPGGHMARTSQSPSPLGPETAITSQRSLQTEKKKFRIQEFIREKRRLRRQQRKEEEERQALENRLREKKLSTLDAKFKKERERIKKQIIAEAKREAKKKRARRNFNKRLREKTSVSGLGRKRSLRDLPNRPGMVAGSTVDLPPFPLSTDEFGAASNDLTEQFQWQQVPPVDENEYGDATELEVQALGVDSNDGCYPTPSSSRPSSSLSQALDDSDVDNGNDSDFLNREAILNGVGTGKEFPKPMYAIPKARPVERVTSLSNTVEAPKVSRPAALADLEQAVATTTSATDMTNGATEEERKRLEHRMDALRLATEQLSARISVFSSQNTHKQEDVGGEDNVVKSIASNAVAMESQALGSEDVQSAKNELANMREAEARSTRHMKDLIEESQEFSKLSSYERMATRAEENIKKAQSELAQSREAEATAVRAVKHLVEEVDELSSAEIATATAMSAKNEEVPAAAEDDSESEESYSDDEEMYSTDPGSENADAIKEGEEQPGVSSLSSSLLVAAEKVYRDKPAPTQNPLGDLHAQDDEFDNVLKDARSIFAKHSRMLDEDFHPQSAVDASSHFAPNTPIIPQVDYKLAAEAAAAVANATRASREALDRARQLEHESRSGNYSRSAGYGAPSSPSTRGNDRPSDSSGVDLKCVERDLQMSDRAYSIVDSYSVLDIYAEESYMYQQYTKENAEMADLQRQRESPTSSPKVGVEDQEEEGQKATTTIAVQTGQYWDSLLIAPADSRKVYSLDGDVAEHDLPSPKLTAVDATKDFVPEPQSPPRSQIRNIDFVVESVERLSPGSLSKKLLTEVDLLQELTESEKQLDALVHASELEHAQKETLAIAHEWQNQQQEAAVMAEMIASEQLHKEEMALQAAQIKLTLQAAHEEQVQSMNAHLEMVRKQHEELKRRESAMQTDNRVLLDTGTEPHMPTLADKTISTSTSGLDNVRVNADRLVSSAGNDPLAESAYEYTEDFDPEESSIGESIRLRKKHSSESIIEEDVIQESLVVPNDETSIQESLLLPREGPDASIAESIKLARGESDASIAEEVNEDGETGVLQSAASMQSIAEEYDQETFEGTSSGTDVIGDEIESGSDDGAEPQDAAGVQASLQRSTNRLMKKVVKDMETRQMHEEELLEVREKAVQERTKMNLEELKLRELTLSEEDLNHEKDKISYTYKKNIAEIQRQRAALQVRHYREILKLRSRHKSLEKLAMSSTETEYSSAVDSEEGTSNGTTFKRKGKHDRSTRPKASEHGSARSLVIGKKKSSQTDSSSDIGEDISMTRTANGESFVLKVVEHDAVEVVEEDEALLVAEGDEYELSVQEETGVAEEHPSRFTRSMSIGSDMYDEDFEDDFEEVDVLHDSIRMQKISQQLTAMSKMDTDLTSAVASSSDASILRKEAELKAKREHAEKLLREKQAIVERAQRRKSLEKEEKRVNELLERALQYDVNTELQKLNLSASRDEPASASGPSTLSPRTPVSPVHPAPQPSLTKVSTPLQPDTSATPDNVLTEDEIEEESIVEATSTSSLGAESYADDFEDSASVSRIDKQSPDRSGGIAVADSGNEEKSTRKVPTGESSTSASFVEEESIPDVVDEVDIGESWKNSMTSMTDILNDDGEEGEDPLGSESIELDRSVVSEGTDKPPVQTPEINNGLMQSFDASKPTESPTQHEFLAHPTKPPSPTPKRAEEGELVSRVQKSASPMGPMDSVSELPQVDESGGREDLLGSFDATESAQSPKHTLPVKDEKLRPLTGPGNLDERADREELMESFDAIEPAESPKHVLPVHREVPSPPGVAPPTNATSPAGSARSSGLEESADSIESDIVETVEDLFEESSTSVRSSSSINNRSPSPDRKVLLESFDTMEPARTPRHLSPAKKGRATSPNVSPSPERKVLLESFDSVESARSPRNLSPHHKSKSPTKKRLSPERKAALADAVTDMLLHDLTVDASTSVTSIKVRDGKNSNNSSGSFTGKLSSSLSASDDDLSRDGLFSEHGVYETPALAEERGNNTDEEALSSSNDYMEDVYDFEDESNLISAGNNSLTPDSGPDGTTPPEGSQVSATKDEELQRLQSEKWTGHAKTYITTLFERIGFSKDLLEELVASNNRTTSEESLFEGGNIKSSVYIEIEKAAGNSEEDGIYNRLIFDSVNEALSDIADNVLATNPPWIRQRSNLSALGVYETIEHTFLKVLESKLYKFDMLDNDPQSSRRIASLNVYSGIPSSAPLTSLERMDTVLTFDALEMEDEWNADYEKVEASVKVQVADLIFEELLFDTAFAVTDAKSH